MEDARARKFVEALVVGANALNEIAKTAARNRKSISSAGAYSDRFHDEVVKLTGVERLILPTVRTISAFDPKPLEKHLGTVKSTTAAAAEREAARKQIRLICETEVLPNIANLTAAANPASEKVLPAAVLAKAPSYLQRTLLQANGNYEQRWFDGCSVMIRKLVENLIIDVYEKHKQEAEIKNRDGDYLMLAALVTAILNSTHWQLGRETKRVLPLVKQLGDRAAHNRRYEATRQDIDAVLPGLRAAADDLLHLAGHK